MGWEPWGDYQFSKNGKEMGLDIELIQAICKDAGFSISLKQVPWKRHLMTIKSGSIDLASGASRSPKREEYAYFSNPYRTESVNLYVRKGDSSNFKVSKLSDIIKLNFHLGVTREYFYGDEFEHLKKEANFMKLIQEVASDQMNYKKLLHKRIDGFLADPVATTSGLKKKKLQGKIEKYPIKIYSDNIFVMFSKKSTTPEDVEKFNQSLNNIKKNGIYEKIVKKYIE